MASVKVDKLNHALRSDVEQLMDEMTLLIVKSRLGKMLKSCKIVTRGLTRYSKSGREAKPSGKTHDKGVLILSGCLGRTFAQHYPLNLAISIAFEQGCSGIDGDSASSSASYAILSSLAGIPINQGIAVTGSLNQKGQIQAIGGVKQKIEGFFEAGTVYAAVQNQLQQYHQRSLKWKRKS
jgi:predicted ATP-dependent protease